MGAKLGLMSEQIRLQQIGITHCLVCRSWTAVFATNCYWYGNVSTDYVASAVVVVEVFGRNCCWVDGRDVVVGFDVADTDIADRVVAGFVVVAGADAVGFVAGGII